MARCEPVYETLPGWSADIRGVRRLADLPAPTRRYLDRVAELVGVPVQIVSVGPAANRPSWWKVPSLKFLLTTRTPWPKDGLHLSGSAQSGRAQRSGRWGRWFKSSLPDN